MSLLSWNSFCQPPATLCFAAMELRVSPLTTLYSPSPFLTFWPVGVVTVLEDVVFFGVACLGAAWRSVEREEADDSVRLLLEPLDDEPELEDEPPL